MDDTVFDELMGETFGQPASEETASPTGAAQSAEDAGWVTDDYQEPAALTEAAESDPETQEAQSEEPVANLDPNELWNSDQNPYKQQAMQQQAEMQKAAKVAQEMRIKQALVQMDQALQQRINALPDMEPEELTKEVQRLIAERDQVKDMVARAQYAETQQQAEQVARLQVMQILTGRYGLSQDEAGIMGQMSDPQQMERFAQTASMQRQRAMSEVEQLRQQLAQYQLNQQAQARRGVDRVGTNAVTGTPAPQKPRNFDEFWSSFVGEG
jgi:hypothetical protein